MSGAATGKPSRNVQSAEQKSQSASAPTPAESHSRPKASRSDATRQAIAISTSATPAKPCVGTISSILPVRSRNLGPPRNEAAQDDAEHDREGCHAAEQPEAVLE